jgi:hypothetical protein
MGKGVIRFDAFGHRVPYRSVSQPPLSQHQKHSTDRATPEYRRKGGAWERDCNFSSAQVGSGQDEKTL